MFVDQRQPGVVYYMRQVCTVSCFYCMLHF